MTAPIIYARLARTMRFIGDEDSARLYAEQYHREVRRHAHIRAARRSLALTYHRLAEEQRASGDEASALIYEAAATEWDEKKHPRAKDGKFASGSGGGGAAGGTSGKKKPEAKKDKETETPETPEWNGEIIQDEVEESGGRGEYLREWDFWDGSDGPFPQHVRLEEGYYDPNPDDPDSEPVVVFRWVSRDEHAGVTENGEWTVDEHRARADGEEFASESHQEPPEEEDEYSDDEEDDSEPPAKLPEKPARRSAAKVVIGDGASRASTEQMLSHLFPDIEDPDEAMTALASSLGAPDDAEVTIVRNGHDASENAYGMDLRITHPAIKEKAHRFIGVESNGDRFIHNKYLALTKEYQNGGFGLELFSDQVASAAAHGFKEIRTHAAGHKGDYFNGYYTWPRFGYNETLASIATYDPNLAKKIRREFPDAKSVRDLMRSQEGRDWWKEEGSDLMEAKFDLREGSWSRFTLAEYLEERAAKKKTKPTEE